jgi:cytochrome b6-f complex iron-sulfur subunit
MAELSPEAKRRIEEAKQRAAQRLGMDKEDFAPPRSGVAEEAPPAAHDAEVTTAAAVKETVDEGSAETPATASQDTPPKPPATQTEAPPQAETAAQRQAARVAAAKAKAAAKPGAETPAKPAAAAAAPRPRPASEKPAPAPSTNGRELPEDAGQEGMNRREFMTYAWGAALGLLALEGGVATYMFMYPRFRAGEFGGKFELGLAASLPGAGSAPQAEATGKFWLVNTQDGPRALYMVCTHLGCLYKWEESRGRFECPCHGSKFTREGFFIEGPAPRSLDEFVVEVVENGEVQARTEDGELGPVPPPVPSPEAQIVVDTGRRIAGKPAAQSPAFHQG